MSSNNKRGAVSLYIVLFTPIILFIFSFLLDGMLTRNIQNATQRHLDVSTLAVVNAARTNGCIINNSNINVGLSLFDSNMNASGMHVRYTLTPFRTPTTDSIGIVRFIVYGTATHLIADMFVPFEYNFKFTIDSVSACIIE